MSGPQVVEQTSKKWKLIQLIGGAVMIVAVAGPILNLYRLSDTDLRSDVPPFDLVLGFWPYVFGIGAVVAAIGRGLAWWHHG